MENFRIIYTIEYVIGYTSVTYQGCIINLFQETISLILQMSENLKLKKVGHSAN